VSVGAVVVGAIVVLVGLFVRTIEKEYTAFTHEIVIFDDGTVAVFEPDSGDWPVWEVEVDESAEDRAVVSMRTSENAEPEPVFAGTRDEATRWARTRGRPSLFEGTAAEADAWIQDQEEAAEQGWMVLALISRGVVIALVGVTTGLQRRNR
jgi:hypothetical protein